MLSWKERREVGLKLQVRRTTELSDPGCSPQSSDTLGTGDATEDKGKDGAYRLLSQVLKPFSL